MTETHDPIFEVYKIRKASLILKAINHKLRQAVIEVIYEHKRITVTELYAILKIEQSVASQHLAILRRAEVLNTERSGKFIYYSINHSRLGEINDFVRDLIG
ncbi:MAG: metalloregulator ArsR/SmtB family transcription factor [Ginsengibacter sp.]